MKYLFTNLIFMKQFRSKLTVGSPIAKLSQITYKGRRYLTFYRNLQAILLHYLANIFLPYPRRINFYNDDTIVRILAIHIQFYNCIKIRTDQVHFITNTCIFEKEMIIVKFLP